jgi:hypothetical protein
MSYTSFLSPPVTPSWQASPVFLLAYTHFYPSYLPTPISRSASCHLALHPEDGGKKILQKSDTTQCHNPEDFNLDILIIFIANNVCDDNDK